jgi:hypothetical protein
MHTDPSMDKMIVGLLKIDDTRALNEYAAVRIQELEAERDELLEALEQCLKFVEHINNYQYTDLGDMRFEDDLRHLIAKAKGEVE